MQKRSVRDSGQNGVHKRPLPLTEVAHEIVAEQLLHLVGRVENEGVLEEGKLLLSRETVVVTQEAVVEGHVDAVVELLVQKLLPRENWTQDVGRVDLQQVQYIHAYRRQNIHVQDWVCSHMIVQCRVDLKFLTNKFSPIIHVQLYMTYICT